MSNFSNLLQRIVNTDVLIGIVEAKSQFVANNLIYVDPDLLNENETRPVVVAPEMTEIDNYDGGKIDVSAISNTYPTIDLQINIRKLIPEFVKYSDGASARNIARKALRSYAQKMNGYLDEKVVQELNANCSNSPLDDGDFGGTAGNGVDVSDASKIKKILAFAEKYFIDKKIPYATRNIVLPSSAIEGLRNADLYKSYSDNQIEGIASVSELIKLNTVNVVILPDNSLDFSGTKYGFIFAGDVVAYAGGSSSGTEESPLGDTYRGILLKMLFTACVKAADSTIVNKFTEKILIA